MLKFVVSIVFLLAAYSLNAQSFEVIGPQDTNVRGFIGETIKVPFKFKNTTDKAIVIVVKRVAGQIGSTQKNFYCLDNNCLDAKVEEYHMRLDAHQTITSLNIALEAGLTQTTSEARYLIYSKTNPAEFFEYDLSFTIDERSEKQNIYTSNHLMLKDVYPNPVIDNAYVDYVILDEQVKAKIVIHNILGNSIEEYALPASENKLKISSDALTAGIYFYTLYVDNEGVITRKLIVKK